MSFVRYTKQARGRKPKAPSVAVTKAGRISINVLALEFLPSGVQFVAIEYSKEENRLRLVEAKEKEPGAKAVQMHRSSASVAAKAALDYFGIKDVAGQSFIAKEGLGETLLIELNTEGA